jgi:ribosomal RNA-processing protein 1
LALQKDAFSPSPEDIRVPASLTFHIADVYMEELDKALMVAPALPVPLATIISPFFILAARTQTNTTYKHIQETLFDPLFSALNHSQQEEFSDGERSKLESSYSTLVTNSCASDPKTGAIDSTELRKGLLRQMFEVASAESTRDSNRRKMYAVIKAAKADDDE